MGAIFSSTEEDLIENAARISSTKRITQRKINQTQIQIVELEAERLRNPAANVLLARKRKHLERLTRALDDLARDQERNDMNMIRHERSTYLRDEGELGNVVRRELDSVDSMDDEYAVETERVEEENMARIEMIMPRVPPTINMVPSEPDQSSS